MWAPLTPNRAKVPFEQAVDWIGEGLLPLGRDYVGVLRNGCLEERWVDVYPNQGKRTGAFSWGAPGTSRPGGADRADGAQGGSRRRRLASAGYGPA